VNAYPQPQSSDNPWTVATAGQLYRAFQQQPQWLEPQQFRSRSIGGALQAPSVFAGGDALLGKVRKYYVLPSDSSVVRFLSEHQTLSPLLLEAVPYLKSSFGEHAVFSLRAPIDDSGSQTLYAVAVWSGSAQSAREALEYFDDRWWIKNSQTALGHLTFTYELV
jgi:hypothetical protein